MSTQAEMAGRKRMLAKPNPACVVCGPKNENGLRIRFERGADGVSAKWVPGKEWQSFQGTIHGGIVTAVLDEAMSQAIIENDWEALTAELKVRFRSRVTPGEALEVRGWINQKQKRRILTEAALSTTDGVERAHAWATFLVLPRVAGTCRQEVER